MKAFFNNGDFFKSSALIKVSALVVVSLSFFYLGKHWSDGYQRLIFFNSRQTPLASDKTPVVSLSPNYNKTFNLSSLVNDTSQTQVASDQTLALIPQTSDPKPLLPPPPPPPPPPPALQRFGIVDENGTMADDFEVGEFDPEILENWGSGNETEVVEGGGGGSRVVVKKFGLCPVSMRENIPCLDNLEAIRRLKSTEKGERFERHCPEKGQGLHCLVPPPKGYRTPIPWPRSRDEVFVGQFL